MSEARNPISKPAVPVRLMKSDLHVPATLPRRAFHWARLALCYLLISVLSVWSGLALLFDFNVAGGKVLTASIYLVAMIAAMILLDRPYKRLMASSLGFAMVLLWWLTLVPSNEGHWQPDVSHTAYAEVDGSKVSFSNVRSCDYRAELDYTCRWLTRQVDLNEIRGVDIFLDYWGSPWIAHTIVSFDIGREPGHTPSEPLAFSIEARKQTGQKYSSVRGFFRQYTLISIVSDERDVVRLRTNYRQGEDLYLYHTRATPEFARSLLLNYVALTNKLHIHPQWYNAVTRNCTTEIFTFQAMKGLPRDWRILLNGKSDAMLYDQDELVARKPGQPSSAPRLTFDELKRRAHINPAAKAANEDSAFSERIREDRPGFGTSK